MARIKEWMDLTELGDNASLLAAGWIAEGINQVIVTSPVYHDVAGNGGAYAIRIQTNSGGGRWRTPPAATPRVTFYPRIHFQMTSWQPGNSVVSKWYRGSTVLGSIAIDPTGHTKLYAGNSATLLATSTNTIAINTWYTLEYGITIGTTGTYEVRVNGTSVGWIPSATGNTKPTSDADVDNISVECIDAGVSMFQYFDDIAADDAGFIGDSLITSMAPNADGTTVQLTRSTGASNFSTVDETPPSDTDFNSAFVVNKEDTYGHAALPGAAATVNCAYIAARVAQASGSAIGTAYLVTRSAGTDYADAGHAITPSYQIVVDLLEHDPATAAPWTVTDLNAAEIGVRFDT